MTQSYSPARPTPCDQTANTDFDHDAPTMQHPVHVRRAVRTALALQQLAHVRLAVRASNQIDTTPVNTTTSATRNDRPAAFNDSTDLSFPQRSSSCILRLDRPQLPATIVQLRKYSTIPATDITHLAEDTDTTTVNFTHALVNMTINCHLCYICYLAFVSFIIFGCHYSHA